MKPQSLDPFLFMESDPPNSFQVQDVPGAGKGLFVTRSFAEKDFLINYRGTISAADTSDNVYTFQVDNPVKMVVDASTRPDCLARYINDVDPFHKKNCEPRVVRKGQDWVIAFYATTCLAEGDELR